MKSLLKELAQREKAKLIAIIEQMLRQEPDIQWLFTTPLPTASPQKAVLDPTLYQQQVDEYAVTGSGLIYPIPVKIAATRSNDLISADTYGSRGDDNEQDKLGRDMRE